MATNIQIIGSEKKYIIVSAFSTFHNKPIVLSREPNPGIENRTESILVGKAMKLSDAIKDDNCIFRFRGYDDGFLIGDKDFNKYIIKPSKKYGYSPLDFDTSMDSASIFYPKLNSYDGDERTWILPMTNTVGKYNNSFWTCLALYGEGTSGTLANFTVTASTCYTANWGGDNQADFVHKLRNRWFIYDINEVEDYEKNTTDKLYLGNRKVEKLYFGNTLVKDETQLHSVDNETGLDVKIQMRPENRQ